jgi:Domain of unknown function (DUF4192)
MTFNTSRPPRTSSTSPLVANLVAAIPYLLGFYPHDSLVLLSTSSPDPFGVDFTLRVDLPPPSLGSETAAELARVLRNHRGRRALLAVVGGVGAPPSGPPGDLPPLPELVIEVTDACAAVGIHVWASVWVAELIAGAPWRCYHDCACDSGCAGELPDPASSPAAAAAVAAGQVTYPNRAALEAVVAPGDPAALRRRAALLDRGLATLTQPGAVPHRADAEALSTLRHWVEVATDRRPGLGDEDVVRLCLALSDPLVRDAAFGFAFAESTAAGAERLWTTLVTEAPDPVAAEPAVLLAHSALLRGDGALAGVALARAQQAWPGHRLSAMFQAAVDAGCGPDQLRDWFVAGCQQATAEVIARGDR